MYWPLSFNRTKNWIILITMKTNRILLSKCEMEAFFMTIQKLLPLNCGYISFSIRFSHNLWNRLILIFGNTRLIVKNTIGNFKTTIAKFQNDYKNDRDSVQMSINSIFFEFGKLCLIHFDFKHKNLLFKAYLWFKSTVWNLKLNFKWWNSSLCMKSTTI